MAQILPFPERLIGADGKATIERYADPRFVFVALTEIEDIFVRLLKFKFKDFVGDGEISEAPPIVPAYNPGDRKYSVIVVEAELNSVNSRGIGYNKFELQYQPLAEDPNTIETWIGYAGEASFTIDIFVRSVNRFATCYYADWVFAALMDPVCRMLGGHGIEIPYDGARVSGKVIEQAMAQGAPDNLDKFWMLTLSIANIIVPWARLYKLGGPTIETYSWEIAPETTHNVL